MTLSIKRLDHFVMTVSNIQKTCNFYQQVLGMQVRQFKENRIALHFGDQKINLHEHGSELEPKATYPKPGSQDLCFLVKTPIDDVLNHLQQLNITIEEGPVDRTGAEGPIRSIYIRDPDGNLIELSNEIIPSKLQAFLDEVNTQPKVPFTITLVRERMKDLACVYSLPKRQVAFINDYVVPTKDHDIPIRIYHPAPNLRLPLLIYIHGGGHACGDLDSHDNLCRHLANICECVVLSIDYRLAPEYPYPAGVEDCVSVFTNLSHITKDLMVNINSVFIAGDSAGGNLAATLSYIMKTNGNNQIKGTALIYPNLDFKMQHPSVDRYGEGYILTKEKISWYYDQYFSGEKRDKASASPLNFKHLEKMSPVYLAIAEYDPLSGEAIDFAKKLVSLNVFVETEMFKGMTHTFAQLETLVPDEINRLVQSIALFVKKFE